MVGHVDHGKTTLLQALTGKWTDIHSEEIKRGITIRLGYADATFYKDKQSYTTKKTKTSKPIRKVSFIDTPGHESLMATMLSGSAIMDGALLLIAANEKCPQPQTKEHLMALEIVGVKNIIIIQNKIDLVTEEEAKDNYKEIQNFIKGTIAEKAPIIPVSAQHSVNIDALIEAIETIIPTPKRDSKKTPLMFIARSFDINKPGTEVEKLFGGVLGGSIKQGILKVNDEIEIRPGLKEESHGKVKWISLKTKIADLKTGGLSVKEVQPGGSIGVLTSLDPSLVKSDSLVGNIAGYSDKLPEVHYELNLKPHLLDRVVGTKEELKVEPIKKAESLLLNVNSAATVGLVTELHKDSFHVMLKLPVCADKKDRVTISRILAGRFRLIGYAEI
ncbi:MAG: translation initiation factor IF-2 subunit gamma, partial [Nanoarchaeota archaeon]